MSLWVDVSGEIRGEHLSVRKAINDFFDEVAIDSLQNDQVSFRFCGDGLTAAKELDSFVKYLRTHHKNCLVDLSASIIF